MVRRALLTFALVGALAAPQGVSGQTSLGVDFTSVTTSNTGSWSLGWSFNVLNSFTVSQLGFYDHLADGLTDSHDIGLWDPFGSLIASATVQAGTGSTLMGFFRMVNIAPISLAAGNDYRIAAVTGRDAFTWNPGGFTTDPNLQYVRSSWVGASSLRYPTSTNSPTGYFGANLGIGEVQLGEGELRVIDEEILISTAPEPMSVLLVGTGLLGVFVLRRRNQDELEIDEA